MADFQNFARAVASRYSGRNAGYPFVRFYGIWNESNLGTFLTPQFNAKGDDRQPGGLREARRRRLRRDQGRQREGARRDRRDVVERARQEEGGRERLRARARSHELVAKANKKLKFDAWAQHPYPVPVNQKPTQKVKWPNVTL